MTTASVRHHLLVQADDTSHRLEENILYRKTFEPVEIPGQGPTFAIVIGIEGRSVWKLADSECVVGPRQLAAFVADPRMLVRRHDSGEARFLLWHFSMDKMRVVREALGQPPTALAATCQTRSWPMAGPFDLNTEQQALVLSLRCAPATPLRNLWYGAKLLELFAILQPPSAPAPSAPGYLHPAVQRTLATLHSHFAHPPAVTEIAAKAGVATTHLSRLFAKETGLTISAYLRQLRMERASRLLLTGDCNVTETALAVGYASLGQFSYAFSKTYGHPPGHHRQAQAARGLTPVQERISR